MPLNGMLAACKRNVEVNHIQYKLIPRRFFMANPEATLPLSEYFQLHQITPGVYAAIVTGDSAAQSNSGIIDLGDRTLIFDTFSIIQAAEDLQRAARRLTGKGVAYVVNSHWHNDHTCGNQVFSQADIISTAKTRERLATTTDDIAQWKIQVPPYLQSLEAKLGAETDEGQRQILVTQVTRYRHLAAMLAKLELRLPNRTFERRFVFHGSNRRVELIAFDRQGHTDGDAILYLPDEKIIFMGDLLFSGGHPWMGHGHPLEWLHILDEVAALGSVTVIPGHGPIGNTDDLALLKQYITDVLQIASEIVKSGRTVEEAAQQPIPEQYKQLDWPEGFAMNMRFLHEFLTKQ
jgi:glyoxylase-like metal-dependent hydrolase (beta-lactamase superfamily II)